MRFESLQNAIQSLLDQTQGLRASQQFHDAQLIEETSLYILAECTRDSDGEFAWMRAFRKIVDTTQSLPCDSFAIESLPLSGMRLEMLKYIPALETIERPEQIDEMIRLAISLGSPLYNHGDPLRCALLYWTTAQTVAIAPLTRGFVGQTKIINGLRKVVETYPVRAATRSATIDKYAWVLRHALDASLLEMQ